MTRDSAHKHFNPRSREGSDLVHALYVVPRWDFNPRSHKGSDNAISGLGISVELFQSALPRGERRSSVLSVFLIYHFNPRSHEGSDSVGL